MFVPSSLDVILKKESVPVGEFGYFLLAKPGGVLCSVVTSGLDCSYNHNTTSRHGDCAHVY